MGFNLKRCEPTETDILHQVRSYLRMCGFYVVRLHQGLGSHKGLADLYAVRDGMNVWIECKKPNGRQSEHQAQFELALKQHGGLYLVARGVEDVREWLKRQDVRCL